MICGLLYLDTHPNILSIEGQKIEAQEDQNIKIIILLSFFLEHETFQYNCL